MSEPWIRVHANLAGKPVVARAVAALGVSENEAIGLLVRFWGAVSQHVVNGYVREVPDRQIELWAGWTGRKRGRFAMFVREAHLDSDGRVREWDEYAGRLEARRAKDRARKEEERARKSRGSHADNQTHRPQDVTPNSIPARANEDETLRDETRRSNCTSSSAGGEKPRDPMERAQSAEPHEAAAQTTPVEAALLQRLPTDAGRGALIAVLAAANNRLGVALEFQAMLNGMHPPTVEPEIMDAALRDYVVNGQTNGTFNATHFRGYIRRARIAALDLGGSADPAPSSAPRTQRSRPNAGEQTYENARRAVEGL